MTKDPDIHSPKVTERINATAFQILKKYPEGMRWSELISNIKDSDSSLHPKTINGCIWKLVENYPDIVYKPSKESFVC